MCALINGKFIAIVLVTALSLVNAKKVKKVNNETIHYNVTSLPKSCQEAMSILPAGSGVYTIYLPKSRLRPFRVYCLEDALGLTPWTVFQRRTSAELDFYQGWENYKKGFGHVNGNFWLGLDKLYALTNDTAQELWISVSDTDVADAHYSHFVIGNEYELYRLKKVGDFSGTTGDDFRYHEGNRFSTYDYLGANNCAIEFRGGWWYNDCHRVNLNGLYNARSTKGMVYFSYLGRTTPVKTSLMAIRPRPVVNSQ